MSSYHVLKCVSSWAFWHKIEEKKIEKSVTIISCIFQFFQFKSYTELRKPDSVADSKQNPIIINAIYLYHLPTEKGIVFEKLYELNAWWTHDL